MRLIGFACCVLGVTGFISACSLATSLDGYSSTRDSSSSSSDDNASGPSADDASSKESSVPGLSDGDGGASYRQTVLGDGPLAYYRLGDADGIAKDEVGGKAGTYSGAVTHGAGAIAGDSDEAAVFDGAGFVDLGDNFSFAGHPAYTLEAWVSPKGLSSGSSACVLAKNVADSANDSPRDGYALYFYGSTQLHFSRYVSGLELESVSSAIPTAEFTHVVAVYDGAKLAIYIDGELDSAKPTTDAIVSVSNSFTIGASRGGTGCKLRGAIDEVAIYGTALGAERIRDHYRAGRGLPR